MENELIFRILFILTAIAMTLIRVYYQKKGMPERKSESIKGNPLALIPGAVAAHGAAPDAQVTAVIHPAAVASAAAEAAESVATGASAGPAVPGAVVTYSTTLDGQRACVVHPAANAAVAAVGAVVVSTGPAVPGAVVAHGATLDGQRAAVVDSAAAAAVAAITAIGGSAVGEFESLEGHNGILMDVQHAIELCSIDDGAAGSLSGDGDGGSAGDVQVAAGVIVFIRSGKAQGVGSSGQGDGVGARQGIGFADGGTQGAVAAAVVTRAIAGSSVIHVGGAVHAEGCVERGAGRGRGQDEGWGAQ